MRVNHSCAVTLPNEGGLKLGLTLVVLTTTVPPLLVFVLMAAFAAAALVAAAIVRRIETWESPELIDCRARTIETGMANVRNSARH